MKLAAAWPAPSQVQPEAETSRHIRLLQLDCESSREQLLLEETGKLTLLDPIGVDFAALLSSGPRRQFSLEDCNWAARSAESAFTGRIGRLECGSSAENSIPYKYIARLRTTPLRDSGSSD